MQMVMGVDYTVKSAFPARRRNFSHEPGLIEQFEVAIDCPQAYSRNSVTYNAIELGRGHMSARLSELFKYDSSLNCVAAVRDHLLILSLFTVVIVTGQNLFEQDLFLTSRQNSAKSSNQLYANSLTVPLDKLPTCSAIGLLLIRLPEEDPPTPRLTRFYVGNALGAAFDSIRVGDITILIDYLFITGQSLGLPACF